MKNQKIVLITGATSGIGRACAIKFAEAGYRVIITGRREELLAALSTDIANMGAEALPLTFDVRDRAQATEALASLPQEWSRIDVLVNNAGLALGLEPEYEGDFEDWDTMIDTNIKGLLTMTRLVVPAMVERNKGQVINIGSVATKAAVKTITDGLRIDLAHTAVRVTNIKPSLVETNFSRTRFHGDNDRADNVYKGITPLSGYDIADVAVYAAQAPAHVQIAEVLVLATHQGSGSVIVRQ